MTIFLSNTSTFKTKALQWASHFKVCCVFDSHNYEDKYSKFDFLLGADSLSELEIYTSNVQAFEQLKTYKQHKNWILGGLAYDLKNGVENLQSHHKDELNFPDLFFFEPKHLLILKGKILSISSPNAKEIYHQIIGVKPNKKLFEFTGQLKSTFTQAQYIATFNKILTHINRGDIYITNFCIEFFADNVAINPVLAFKKLSEISPAPFANFFKWDDKFIISASPERFLAKRGNKIIAQPIKGTAKRNTDLGTDKQLKTNLQHDYKEQQENVMIVDLLRNDLTKSAKASTVTVEELFGVYTFAQVHQMISTVVCQAKPELDAVEIIKNTFPMGSMTGAPKLKAMQIIELYESTKRGVYSGAIGYFSPDGDFDFNVIIRTMLYNASKKYLSFEVGSAITTNANAEKEYEECLLKAEGILRVLDGK
ncbi:MAG: anthranilate synthase component I family protein [Sphingobacteriales bacterium]|nr:MAG: anthranilate synthase component I family protein [Sphingobacteriales bacterium]TAF79822.1 MAG: anthranilate synthase component I family protein [Sphingobacteriales bacterium]